MTRTHSTDIDWADMGVEPEPAQPEPDDILYAILRKDIDAAAADIATYMNGEWPTSAISGALYRAIERTIEGVLKNPGKQIMESKGLMSEAFWTELKNYEAYRNRIAEARR